MKVQTKWFGEIEVSDDKIITFDKGIIGFEDWKKYTLVYDAEKEENIIFGGRLGEYKYYDMDAVIASALECARNQMY